MRPLFRKWWFWVIVILVILLIIMLLPIWCNTYYLPTYNDTIEKMVECGPFFNLFKVY